MNANDSPVGGRWVYYDSATMCLHNLVCNRQPKSRAVCPCCEERVEHPSANFFGNAVPAIRTFDDCKAVLSMDFDIDRSARIQRLHCVGQNVIQYLPQLGAVSSHSDIRVPRLIQHVDRITADQRLPCFHTIMC